MATPAAALLLAAAVALGAGPSPAAETYRYLSRPAGAAPGAQDEAGTVEIEVRPEGLAYRGRTRLPDGRQERVEIEADPRGALLRARRGWGDAQAWETVVRAEGASLLHERVEAGAREVRRLPVPAGALPAADASVLLLLRTFPYGTGAEREVFFVDFSGRSVSGTLRETGRETVRVPAGVFECLRVELELRVWLFRPSVLFWVTASPPHFLVRQEGKRSALSPRYRTELAAPVRGAP